MNHDKCLSGKDLENYLQTVIKGTLRGIIFDCDGVLIDSVESNMQYYNLVRNKFDLPPLTEEQRHFCQMSSAMQAFDHIIPAALRPSLMDVLREVNYAQDIEPHIPPSAHVIPFLKNLYPYLKLGVHTNRMSGVDKLLHRLGMKEFLDPIMTVDNSEPKPSPDGSLQILKKWELDPCDVLFIGDSSTDKNAARGANVAFLSYQNPTLVTEGTCCDFNELFTALNKLYKITA